MTFNIKRHFILVSFVLFATFALCTLDCTVDNIIYESDNILKVTGDKSNIISETEQI